MCIRDSNNTSPGTRLDVKQDNAVAYNNTAQTVSYNAARFLNTSGHTSGGTYTGFQFNISGDSQNRICSMGMISEASDSKASSLVFHTDDGGNRTEKVRITSAGDVGIGTIAPTHTGAGATTGNTATLAVGILTCKTITCGEITSGTFSGPFSGTTGTFLSLIHI